MSEFVHHADILAVDKQHNSLDLQLLVPENLYYFQGHFPAAPVLPGVVLTHWVLEYITQYFGKSALEFQGLSALKFQIIIRPGYLLNLKLSQVNEHKYSFSYSSSHGQHASGKVMFG